MASRETPAEQIERLLRVSDAPGAIRAASALIASSPTSFLGRLGRCRALLMMGRVIEAERDLAAALAASPKDDHANLLRATLDNRYGRAEEGIARLRPMALGRGPQSVEAMTTLMDILFQTGKRDELRAQTRAWVAEENRHGDLLNKYCWLTGRVDMRAVEVTIQRLIGSGMDPKTENNPYLGFVYTSFQVRGCLWLLGGCWVVVCVFGDPLGGC